MTAATRRIGIAERGWLPEGRMAGPMPWVIAIMMFLTCLAAAAALGLAGAAGRLGQEIGGRVTVQIVEADPARREAQAAAALTAARALPAVMGIVRVPDEEVARLIEPWLGQGGMSDDIPVPALIELELAAGTDLQPIRAALTQAAPAARIDDAGQWLAPLASLIAALQWLAAGLVLLMIGATAATVVLAARAAVDTHKETIQILHLMGATDVQVARLFQRRIALDAAFGGLVGFILAGLVLVGLGDRLAALGSELLGTAALPPLAWLLLVTLPVFGVVLATLVARITILRALGKML